MKFKDANAYLEGGNKQAFLKKLSSAGPILPDGVISSFNDIANAISGGSRKALVDLPYKGLQEKLEGLAPGETVLFSGLPGIGKTEIFRALEHHILKTTDYNIGLIHIEEKRETTIQNLLTYELQVPLKRAATEISLEEQIKAYKNLVRREDRCYIYSHYGSDSPDTIIGIVRYLVAVCGCKFIFFDHINIAVSGLGSDASMDERKTLDYLSTRLNTLAIELDFNLVAICHITDGGETRGSRNMSQTFHVHVRLARDIKHPNPKERSKLNFEVIKNRPVGPSGPAGFAYYNENTGVLEDGDLYIDIPDLPEEGGQNPNV